MTRSPIELLWTAKKIMIHVLEIENMISTSVKGLSAQNVNSRDFDISPFSRHSQYARDFVISSVSGHFPYSKDLSDFARVQPKVLKIPKRGSKVLSTMSALLNINVTVHRH